MLLLGHRDGRAHAEVIGQRRHVPVDRHDISVEGKIRNDETILDDLDEAWRSVNMLLVRIANPSS